MDGILTIAVALNRFVRLPGETMEEFTKQLRSLTAEDRKDYIRIFASEGVECVDPKSA